MSDKALGQGPRWGKGLQLNYQKSSVRGSRSKRGDNSFFSDASMAVRTPGEPPRVALKQQHAPSYIIIHHICARP